MAYPKRLIEVDLPIKRISEHARREKSIRHGHISTLHIWWARRPLAACRAVICAALWPDPADPDCPPQFRKEAARLITQFARQAATSKDLAETCAPDTWQKWKALAQPGNKLDPDNEAHLNVLRFALLDFIADFANWDNSTKKEYLETSRALTQAAHVGLGGEPGTRPLVVDPFAGGGSIPLEALRVGADAFASDINPIPVLLNKVVLEYIPKYGQRLVDEVRKWGEWVKKEGERELADFYPKDESGARPIAYLWARTILCEGPGCGVEIPLFRTDELDRQNNKRFSVTAKKHHIEILVPAQSKPFGPTIKGGSVVCPRCGFVTQAKNVRSQLSARRGGAHDARLLCCIYDAQRGRDFKPVASTQEVSEERVSKLIQRKDKSNPLHGFRTAASELINPVRPSANARGVSPVTRLGINTFADLYTPRQLASLIVLTSLVRRVYQEILNAELSKDDSTFAAAVSACLACVVDRVADYNNSLCTWVSAGGFIGHAFTKQALSNVWDFAEIYPFSGSTGSFQSALNWVCGVIEATAAGNSNSGTVVQSDARIIRLPENSAEACITDPPYYAEIPYADISDFFYIWMRQSLGKIFPDLFKSALTEKSKELIVTASCPDVPKDSLYFEEGFKTVSEQLRVVVKPGGIIIIVFANAKTDAWEAMLQSILDGGLQIHASWAIDTEMVNRTRARGAASLQSSIHIVCRPRENPDGSLRTDEIGDWRGILQELPQRIHEWMPRLSAEGVVGADAIFACLGPALEIFSRYSRVEKASGEQVALKEYLEYVWAAVAKEALNMIFAGADATGFEEDARLTSMWLWTLSAGAVASSGGGITGGDGEGDEIDTKAGKVGGFILEYDAARKIAQGLGAYLENLTHLVEINGNKARLLPVSERAKYLFGKDEAEAPAKRGKKLDQSTLFDIGAEGSEGGWGDKSAPPPGDTVLDRVHQSMILFAAGRSEALRRFLVDDGVGKDQRFWRLAQALSALYPANGDEKRWVDGVLARKKGLGF